MSNSSNRFSGAWDNWVARFGSVTQLILWTCVIVFLIQLICSFVGFTIRVAVPGMPAPVHINVMDYLFGLSPYGILHAYIWQPLTYMFLHEAGSIGIPWHILINMLILWFIGREVEYFIGPKYFARLYFLGGIFGGLLWLACNLNSFHILVGASAGVLACVVAFATLFPEREMTFLLWFIIPVRIKAKYLAMFLVALDVLPLLQRAGTGVGHLAHLGGAAFGYIYIKHLGYGQTPRWIEAISSLVSRLKPQRRTMARPASTTRPPLRAELNPESYIRDQVDPILEKISRDGMQSLTPEERKTLESAQELLKKRHR